MQKSIQQAIDNEFVRRERTIDRQVVTLITQVEVDPEDPAFDNPTKPVGSFLTPDQAENHRERGHIVIDDSGRGFRRVVPSPQPQSIFELDAIEHLLEVGMIVICVGGGGIPIVRKPDGTLRGVPAVIDKDLASSLLATELEADLFLISTAVEQVVLDFGSANPTPLDSLTTSQARQLLAEGQFPPGSMGPKIQGICNYMDSGGSLGIITNPENFKKSLRGDTGTRFVPEPDLPKSSSLYS